MATKFILVVTIQGLGFWGWVLGISILWILWIKIKHFLISKALTA
jgi:hypothetical protein